MNDSALDRGRQAAREVLAAAIRLDAEAWTGRPVALVDPVRGLHPPEPYSGFEMFPTAGTPLPAISADDAARERLSQLWDVSRRNIRLCVTGSGRWHATLQEVGDIDNAWSANTLPVLLRNIEDTLAEQPQLRDLPAPQGLPLEPQTAALRIEQLINDTGYNFRLMYSSEYQQEYSWRVDVDIHPEESEQISAEVLDRIAASRISSDSGNDICAWYQIGQGSTADEAVSAAMDHDIVMCLRADADLDPGEAQVPAAVPQQQFIDLYLHVLQHCAEITRRTGVNHVVIIDTNGDWAFGQIRTGYADVTPTDMLTPEASLETLLGLDLLEIDRYPVVDTTVDHNYAEILLSFWSDHRQLISITAEEDAWGREQFSLDRWVYVNSQWLPDEVQSTRSDPETALREYSNSLTRQSQPTVWLDTYLEALRRSDQITRRTGINYLVVIDTTSYWGFGQVRLGYADVQTAETLTGLLAWGIVDVERYEAHPQLAGTNYAEQLLALWQDYRQLLAVVVEEDDNDNESFVFALTDCNTTEGQPRWVSVHPARADLGVALQEYRTRLYEQSRAAEDARGQQHRMDLMSSIVTNPNTVNDLRNFGAEEQIPRQLTASADEIGVTPGQLVGTLRGPDHDPGEALATLLPQLRTRYALEQLRISYLDQQVIVTISWDDSAELRGQLYRGLVTMDTIPAIDLRLSQLYAAAGVENLSRPTYTQVVTMTALLAFPDVSALLVSIRNLLQLPLYFRATYPRGTRTALWDLLTDGVSRLVNDAYTPALALQQHVDMHMDDLPAFERTQIQAMLESYYGRHLHEQQPAAPAPTAGNPLQQLIADFNLREATVHLNVAGNLVCNIALNAEHTYEFPIWHELDFDTPRRRLQQVYQLLGIPQGQSLSALTALSARQLLAIPDLCQSFEDMQILLNDTFRLARELDSWALHRDGHNPLRGVLGHILNDLIVYTDNRFGSYPLALQRMQQICEEQHVSAVLYFDTSMNSGWQYAILDPQDQVRYGSLILYTDPGDAVDSLRRLVRADNNDYRVPADTDIYPQMLLELFRATQQVYHIEQDAAGRWHLCITSPSGEQNHQCGTLELILQRLREVHENTVTT